MTPVTILKLGGSVATHKRRGRRAVRTAVVRGLVREIVRFRRAAPAAPMILLHGGGSFGHPLAHRFGLQNGVVNAERLRGAGLAINAMRELTTRIAALCLSAGLPVFPLQTSAMVARHRGRLRFSNLASLRTILRSGGIPLFGGDAILTGRRTMIVSADALAVTLARHFPGSRILFATDVDGVYAAFPPPRGARPLRRITRDDLGKLICASSASSTRYDVTGGMANKLRALRALRHHRARIFCGTDAGAARAAFSGKPTGTVIEG